MTTEDLIRALQECIDATGRHEKALAEYKGYSWDYHGSCYIEEMEAAQEHFEKALNNLINDRVAAAVAKALK